MALAPQGFPPAVAVAATESTEAPQHLSIRVSYRAASWCVLGIGAVLRVWLALVNQEANDDHLAVSRFIVVQHRFPKRDELWEAFQPHLYHALVARIWELVPGRSDHSLILVGQFVSCAAGIGTLLLARRALKMWRCTPDVELISFALLALNPKLIGLNAQATNDSLVILFATAAFTLAVRFLQTGQPRAFVLALTTTFLGLETKGSAVIAFVLVSLAFLAATLGRPHRWDSHRHVFAAITLLFTVGTVAYFGLTGPYRASYDARHDWFAINVRPDPPPGLVHQTYLHRPGTTSVVDAYLTFRFADLLAHPSDTNGTTPYPQHRTSLWSQVYGRTASVHFDQWPPSWADTRPLVRNVTRALLILGLLPTGLLLAGFAATFDRWRSRFYETAWDERLLVVVAIAFLALLVDTTFRYRDFDAMKAEYMFPGLLGFLFVFARGCESALAWCRARPVLARLAVTSFAALLILGTVDVGVLIDRLS